MRKKLMNTINLPISYNHYFTAPMSNKEQIVLTSFQCKL